MQVLNTLVSACLPPRPPGIFSFARYLNYLLQPRRETHTDSIPIVPPVLSDVDYDQPYITLDALQQGEQLLTALEKPERLSCVIQKAQMNDDSIFAMTSSDYRRSGSADDRLIDGLILVAILATMYPRAQDLEEDAQIVRPSITVEDVEKTLRTLCEQLETASQRQPDPSVQDLAAGLIEAWQAYRDRVAKKSTSNGRAATGMTVQMNHRAFDMLERQACVRTSVRDDKKGYRPTWKYQVMVREASVARLAGVVRKLVASEGE